MTIDVLNSWYLLLSLLHEVEKWNQKLERERYDVVHSGKMEMFKIDMKVHKNIHHQGKQKSRTLMKTKVSSYISTCRPGVDLGSHRSNDHVT